MQQNFYEFFIIYFSTCHPAKTELRYDTTEKRDWMGKDSALYQLMDVRMHSVMNGIVSSDGEYQYLIPSAVSLCPFFYDIFTGQIEHLLQGLVAWKHTFCLCHFPVLAVQCFYDIGGLHNAAYII